MHPLLQTISKDPSYGYTKDNPVRVGPVEIGPAASRHYLMCLRDAIGRPFDFGRVGNVGNCSDGHVVDLYRLESHSGEEFDIYIDMYHPECDPDFQDAPLGFTKGSPNSYPIEMARLAKNPPKMKVPESPPTRASPISPPRKKLWWQFWK